MEDVTTADLLAYRQSIQHLAASSQNRYLAAIKSFFAWALDTGMIEKNPAAGLKLPKAVSNRAPVFLTLDETRRLIATAILPRDIALLWCLAYGLRIAEAQALPVRNELITLAAETLGFLLNTVRRWCARLLVRLGL